MSEHSKVDYRQSDVVTITADAASGNERRLAGAEPKLAPPLVLDQFTASPTTTNTGPITLREDIQSTDSPFTSLPEYRTQYPSNVTQAISDLYREYNMAFTPLIEANREWDTDYQYCMTGPNGTPVNYFVQIDMVGLPEDFLTQAASMSVEQVRDILRGRIFELENSLAHYQLLQEIFSSREQDSHFKQVFRSSIHTLRQRFGKKIAILTVTDEKYAGVKAQEFGRQADEALSDEEVMQLSGFDKLFSPGEFETYIREQQAKGAECEYLLVVRSSDPISKLRKPNTEVSVPLLENDDMRRIIKAHSLTLNINKPGVAIDSSTRINDTKAYMPAMGMAYPMNDISDLTAEDFARYLLAQGVSQDEITSGQVRVHAKPMYSAYGAYGHHHAELGNRKLKDDLKTGIRKRGPYVVQPEMHIPTLIDSRTGQAYMYIDRNFFTVINGTPVFMGGFRSLMPLDTTEASRGRVHGNDNTVWAEIY